MHKITCYRFSKRGDSTNGDKCLHSQFYKRKLERRRISGKVCGATPLELPPWGVTSRVSRTHRPKKREDKTGKIFSLCGKRTSLQGERREGRGTIPNDLARPAFGQFHKGAVPKVVFALGLVTIEPRAIRTIIRLGRREVNGRLKTVREAGGRRTVTGGWQLARTIGSCGPCFWEVGGGSLFFGGPAIP